jgi:hypothetical protein
LAELLRRVPATAGYTAVDPEAMPRTGVADGLFPGAGVGNIVAQVRRLDTIRQSLTSSALTLALDLSCTALRDGLPQRKRPPELPRRFQRLTSQETERHGTTVKLPL